jgi:hypothetical protein
MQRPLWRPESRRKDNIKMVVEGIVCEPEEWIELAQNKDQRRASVNTVKDQDQVSNCKLFKISGGMVAGYISDVNRNHTRLWKQ